MSICLFIGAFICFIGFVGTAFNDKLSTGTFVWAELLNTFLIVVMVLAGIALL